MNLLQEILALLLCLGPVAILVMWLMWLSRRAGVQCPNCSRKVAHGTSHCPACGTEMPAEDAQQPE